jgi:hypothetical protein
MARRTAAALGANPFFLRMLGREISPRDVNTTAETWVRDSCPLRKVDENFVYGEVVKSAFF